MTKVKVKGAFISKPFERARTAEEEDEDDDEEEEEQQEESRGGNFMPFVRAQNKRKRGPRGAPRHRHRESLGLQSEGFSDSALATSSSQRSDMDDDEVGDSAQNHSDGHGGAGHGFGESTTMDAPRRGSVRMKVKPSKFREDPSQSNDMAEGKSSLKKRTAGPSHEPTGSKHQVFARDYTSLDRQQGSLTDELKTALMVVRKIMKMEAAEPFNIPVDPVALGIPDYFDIVKKPMDLGTVCKNLERGGKYRGSQDVYEDVQLVWTNCRIYNQKGDPILELLARVKKNFMKYWTAAGLYTEKSPATFKFQGRSPDSLQSEFGGPSIKQRDMDEDIDIGRNKKVTKIAKEADSPANSTAKRSGSIEQGAIESKATKLRPSELATGLHREQEAASNILNDNLDMYFLNREGPKIISVYKAHKKKKLELQDNISKEHPVQAGLLKGPEQEADQKSGGRGNSTVKHANADKSQRKKDADSHATPSKSRRVSGTGHHKADCSCVVCTGVRRKLAREGKLGNPANTDSTSTANAAKATAEAAGSTPITQERILVRLKTEANSDGSKTAAGAGSRVRSGQSTKERRDNLKSKERERAHEENNVHLKKVKVDEGDEVFMDAAFGGGAGAMKTQGNILAQERKNAVKEEAMPEQNKDNSVYELKLDSEKGIIEEGSKGAVAEDLEDKEDAVQNDEHFTEILDAETDRQEGGVRYYRASYEMPLRKINPSILHMGQRLFGNGSPWNRGRSLGSHSAKSCSKNPILTTVSLLLQTKGT